MAEGEGFEPPVPFQAQRFSRPPVSTAHPSLRTRKADLHFQFTAPSIASASSPLDHQTNLPMNPLPGDLPSSLRPQPQSNYTSSTLRKYVRVRSRLYVSAAKLTSNFFAPKRLQAEVQTSRTKSCSVNHQFKLAKLRGRLAYSFMSWFCAHAGSRLRSSLLTRARCNAPLFRFVFCLGPSNFNEPRSHADSPNCQA
jgi:hypothetical protein